MVASLCYDLLISQFLVANNQMMDHRSIMSGQRQGPLASLIRAGLAGLSIPYRIVVGRRNRSYDRQSTEIHSCGVPVVSVGNLTTGGTGKTPVVCYLAKWYRQRGVRVAIISRGYGRGDGDSNDEALELHARLPDVPHVQDPDRVEAARIAVEELEAELILMDDGFQHRRLHRDLNIVVIDATCPFGYGHLLPRGLLREPLASLSRADLVIISRFDAVDVDVIHKIERAIRDHHAGVPILHCNHRPTSLLEHPDSVHPIIPQNVAAVSAIGNPAAFEQSLHRCGLAIVESRRLPDHDAYSPETVAELRDWIESIAERIDRVVCTHKDLVKLQTGRLGGKPIAALLIELAFVGDTAALDASLEAVRVSPDLKS